MAHVMHTGHLRVPALASRHSPRLVYALFVLTASAVSIGAITAVAYWSGHPLVVPSLGPTAFLVFNRSQTPAARPRNIIIGHLLGAASGYLALLAFGLAHAPPVTHGGLTPARIGAAAVSIALTTGSMIALRAEHGPAGATTLIVSLGFMTTIGSLALLMAGVAALAALGVAIDRLAGLHLPFWSGQRHRPDSRPIEFRPSPTLSALVAANGNGQHAATPTVHARRLPASNNDPGCQWTIASGEGRHVAVGAARDCTVKVENACSDGSYSLLEVALGPASPPVLQHVHYTFSESYVVTQGQVCADIAGRTIHAGPGTVIHVPAGVAHAIGNTGRTPATCLCITAHAQQSEPEYLP